MFSVEAGLVIKLAILAPIATTFVAAEILFFSAVHLTSASSSAAPLGYWLFVAAICAFVIYGRLILKPIHRGEFA